MKRLIVSAFFCGEGYDKANWKELFYCDQCRAIFDIPVALREPQLTPEEAEANFNKIPLTDKKALSAARRRKG